MIRFALDAGALETHAPALSVEQPEFTRRESERFFMLQKTQLPDERYVTLVLPPVGSPAMAWPAGPFLGLPPDVRYLLEKA